MAEKTEIFEDSFQKARGGEKQHLEEVARSTRTRLRGYVHRVTLDENLTEDIVQESMMDVFRVFGKIKNTDHLWARLYLAANSKIKNHYGRQWRRATKYLADVEGELEDRKAPNGLEDVVTEELKQIVNESVGKLEPRQRAVMTMRCYEKLSYRQIAKALDCNELAARALFFRAKKDLAKNLAGSGLGKGALVLALVLFGKLTAPTQAAAANVTIAASALNVGLTGAAVGTAVSTKAIVGIAAAGALAAGTVMMATDGPAEWAAETQAVQAPVMTAQAGQQQGEMTERWYYYPQESSDIVMSKVMRYDEDGEKAYCEWLQNHEKNLYYDSQDGAVYLVNHRAWLRETAILPSDPAGLRQFIAGVQGQGADTMGSFGAFARHGAGLLVTEKPGEAGKVITETAYHSNITSENYFNFDWPAGTEVVDRRDAMHRQGWCGFTMTGRIGGTEIRGQGFMPFVYTVYERYRPWLRVTIGGEKYADRSAGTLFAGLSRPWQGLHTIDTVRRDAAKERLAFTMEFNEDETIGTVTVADGALRMVYTIDMERDLLERVVYEGAVTGEIRFTYTEKIPGGLQAPRRNVIPRRELEGLQWPLALLDSK